MVTVVIITLFKMLLSFSDVSHVSVWVWSQRSRCVSEITGHYSSRSLGICSE